MLKCAYLAYKQCVQTTKTLQSSFLQPEAVPVASNEERPMPDARRAIDGSTETATYRIGFSLFTEPNLSTCRTLMHSNQW
jgi:hypothetical protein